MFNAKDKITGEVVKVYAVDGGDFMIARDGAFKWVSGEGFSPVADPDIGPANDCTLTVGVTNAMNLSDLIAGIANGKVELSVGNTITTRLKSGKEVDFVVTDVDDEAYRLESRDCMGRYDPMTEIDKFFSDMWADLPDVLRDNIIETERQYKDGNGKVRKVTRALFLPAASEIFPPESCYGDEGLYEQMEWYKDVHNRVRAFEKGGASDWYWTQSQYSGNTTFWCSVNYYGYAHYNGASSTAIAAPVCFRIRRFSNPRP